MTYAHRNGETGTPTDPGKYWFNGFLSNYAGTRYHIMDIVEFDDSQWVYTDMLGTSSPKEEYSGQWWGPLVSPWQCPDCGQIAEGQTGEYPCPTCGLPRMWDSI
jgi:hypothetical protein